MEPGLRDWLSKIEDSVKETRQEINDKLDDAASKFQNHVLADQDSFKDAGFAVRELRTAFESLVAQRAKEASDQRLAKIEEDKKKETELKRTDATKYARWAFWSAILAALLGAIIASCLSMWEHSRIHEEHTKVLQYIDANTKVVPK